MIKQRILQLRNDPQISKLLQERETVRKAKEKVLRMREDFNKKRAELAKQIEAKNAQLREKVFLGDDDHVEIAKEIIELKKSDEVTALSQAQVSSGLLSIYDEQVEGIEQQIRRRVAELLRPIWEEEREAKTKIFDGLIERHKAWAEAMAELDQKLGLKVHKGQASHYVLRAPNIPDLEERRRHAIKAMFK